MRISGGTPLRIVQVACLAAGLSGSGVQADDPMNKYQYLEDLRSSETINWIKEQDERTRTYLSGLDGFRTANNLLGRYATSSNMNLPEVRNGQFFYLDETANVPQASLYMRGEDKPASLIIDPRSFGVDLMISRFDVTSDGSKVAVELSSTVSGDTSVLVYDVTNQQFYSQAIPDGHLGIKSWFDDGRSLVFWREDENKFVVHHRRYLGSDGAYRDRPIYEQTEPLIRFQVWASRHSVVVQHRYKSGEYGANRVWLDGREPTLLSPRQTAPLYYLGDHNGKSYCYSTGRGANGVVSTVDSNGPGEPAFVFEPDVPVNGIYLLGGNLLVDTSVDGKPVLRLFSERGEFRKDVMPPYGLVWNDFPQGTPSVWGSPDSDVAYYRSTALFGSGIYAIDIDTAEQRPVWRRYPDETERIVTQHHFTSFDGTQIPVTMVSSGGETAGPVLVWAYGAYGFTAWPFHNAFFAAFLDAGGKIAFPHVRGGGVYGPEWRKAGSGKNKINTVQDVIGAVNWLLDQGYSTAGQIALLGNSAGSVPVAKAAFELGDKVGALILEVPLSDMERYAEWAPFWSREFGDPGKTDELDVLREISPYRSALQANAFPPTMIVAGEKDQTAVPHHAYKLAAAMQDRQQGAGGIFLYSVKDAGHSVGTTRVQRHESWAYELSFLLDALRMNGTDKTKNE